MPRAPRPAGTLATQEKMTVTVKALDMAAPSITVTTDNGRVITRKIEDKKNLEGVKLGDKIEITHYTGTGDGRRIGQVSRHSQS